MFAATVTGKQGKILPDDLDAGPAPLPATYVNRPDRGIDCPVPADRR